MLFFCSLWTLCVLVVEIGLRLNRLAGDNKKRICQTDSKHQRIHIRLFAVYKSAVGADVSTNGCRFLCVSLCHLTYQ